MGGLKESRQHQIEIKETTPTVFRAVLKFLYTGDIDLFDISEDIVDVLVASTRFVVPQLKKLLEGESLDCVQLSLVSFE